MGQEAVYEEASSLLEKYLRVRVSAKQIERLCNTYGEIVAGSLYAERLDQGRSDAVYIMVDGSMLFTREDGWKEAKLGRLFEQGDHLQMSAKRNWIKDSQYVAHMGSLRGFLDKMESVIPTQSRQIFVADGAKWIWNWVESLYPEATQILDFYHAKEHACEFATMVFPKKETRQAWIEQIDQYLKQDQLDLAIEAINGIKLENQKVRKARDQLLHYYWNNYKRMQYKTFKEKGYLIGSGPIEAAHRTVLQKRLKRPGQRWIKQNAQKIINLRVANLSNKWNLISDHLKMAA